MYNTESFSSQEHKEQKHFEVQSEIYHMEILCFFSIGFQHDPQALAHLSTRLCEDRGDNYQQGEL